LTDNTNRYKLQFIESVLTTVNDFFFNRFKLWI